MNEIIFNYKIQSPRIRIVNWENKPPFTMAFRDAIQLAKENSLDLIQLSHDSKENISTCQIMEIGKYKYQLSKKTTTNSSPTVKEFKFGINIEEHDIETKITHAKELLNKHHPVRIVVFLKRYQKEQKAKAMEVFEKVVSRFDLDTVEQNKKISELNIVGNYVKKRI